MSLPQFPLELPISTETQQEIRHGKTTQQTADGSIISRRSWRGQKLDLELVLPPLYSWERSLFDDFYTANEDNTFEMAWESVTRQWRFKGPPKLQIGEGSVRSYTVEIYEV
ncbi:MAG: hypothetical protein LBI35_07295 [Burkholderiales bacterium]|jgi:hypothetical protein|nr:hypothetical protein [Burkholderiales bacterium]